MKSAVGHGMRSLNHLFHQKLTRSIRTIALSSLGMGILTLSLFIYILLLPLLNGEQPNVCCAGSFALIPSFLTSIGH